MSHYLKKIVEIFSRDARQCLDTAVSMAVSSTHHEVTVEHLLMALVTTQPSLIEKLCLQTGLRGDLLVTALTNDISQQRSGNTRGPVLSEWLVQHLEKAWLHASICWGHACLSAPAFLACLMVDPEDPALPLSSEVMQALRCDTVKADRLLAEITAKISGNDPTEKKSHAGETALTKYTHNVTERARRGELDPATGRENEIRQVIDVLLRRRQNNPVLMGEPGVGKTALVEGLAQRIVSGAVPGMLKKMDILSLDLSLLQAGASVKGEFENVFRSC